jgi:hypothetical protein
MSVDNNSVPSLGQVIGDPDTVVNGRTITQWAKDWIRSAFLAPNTENAFNDPSGSVASAFNADAGRMYFITGAPPSDVRTFDVRPGQSVLVPMNTIEDSEGPGISPTIPGFVPSMGTYADEVRTVLSTSQFTNGTVELDGRTTTDLRVLNTGIFSAGVVTAGSEAQQFFGSDPGTSLRISGDVGYWIVLKGLTPGKHTLTTSSDFSSPYFTGGSTIHETRTDIINVVPS